MSCRRLEWRIGTAHAVVALMAVAGCRRLPSPGATTAEVPVSVADSTAPADSAVATTVADSDWIRTPAGLMHRSCVHHIPAGAAVHGDTVRTADGGSYVLPRCRYKGISTLPPMMYGPPGVVPPTLALPVDPNLVARVVSRRRERADPPRPYSQMDLEVRIGPATGADAIVIVADGIKVYRRSGIGRLTAVTNDSIADRDVIEIWHDGGPDPRLTRLVGRPVYFALQVVVRGGP
jgi:hypothetical protein